jgi:hypothetical protein
MIKEISMQSSRIFRSALCWTFFQILILLFVTGGHLRDYVHWDANWYSEIASIGYDGAYPLKEYGVGGSSIAFFPAHPLAVRAVMRLFHIDAKLAVTFAAQLACIGLWAYLLLILRRLRLNPLFSFAAALLFFVQPGSFYTVIGYSEALFTASMLGYVYWSTRWIEENRGKSLYFALAVIHGIVLGSTRILGLALLGFPLLLLASRTLATRKLNLRQTLGATLLGVLSLSGFAAFLAYCHFRWGHWDAYWEANRIGWHVYLDPWVMFNWEYFRDVFFIGTLSELLGRMLTLITLGFAVKFTLWSWRRNKIDSLPLALSLLNVGLMVQTVLGSHGMHSMIRYLIPIHALLIPLLGGWAQEKWESRTLTFRAGVFALVVTYFLFAIQIVFTIRYSRGGWVS